MLTRIQLTNFKSWRKLDMPLAPLTVLFGTNSSGKSSVLQALLLLSQNTRDNTWGGINFGGNPDDYVNLGSHRDVVYDHKLSNTIEIDLEWRLYKNNRQGNGALFLYSEDGLSGSSIQGTLIDLFVTFQSGLKNREESLHYLGPIRQHPQRSYLWSGAIPNKIEADGDNAIAVLIASERGHISLAQLHHRVAEWLAKLELVDGFAMKSLDVDERFYETTVTIGKVESALLDVGFGISQVLPVITTLFFVPEGSIVLLEQPELHLHPRAQAHLADLFLHVAKTRKLQLIVESHSEHLLRRLQRRIAEAESPYASPENIKMYFCDKGENGSTAQEVKVDAYGQILNWPERFFGDITGDLEKMAMAALQRSRNGH